MSRPIALVSKSYNWEADPGVLECLVFLGNDSLRNYNKKNDIKQASFKLRSILQGDGSYIGVVRHGVTSEIIYEIPTPIHGRYTAMNMLMDSFLVGFELKEAEVEWVPDIAP